MPEFDDQQENQGTQKSETESMHSANQAVVNLLGRVSELIMKYGAKSITMDDVATELGISKKTLYKHFGNKRELVQKVMQFHVECERSSMLDICSHTGNAISQMMQIFRHVSAHLVTLNPIVIHDTQKYYPASWKYFEDYKMTFIYNCLIENLKLGVEQGLYREEMDLDIITRLYLGRMDMFTNHDMFPVSDYSITKVYTEFMNYHIRGISTPRGVAFWEEIKRNNDE